MVRRNMGQILKLFTRNKGSGMQVKVVMRKIWIFLLWKRKTT